MMIPLHRHASLVVAMRAWGIVMVLICSASAWSQCAEGPPQSSSTVEQFNAACAAMRPRWIARASAVYMDRVTEDSLVLMQNTADASEQLNANDFDFGWVTGLDLSLLRKSWDDTGYEVRYLGLRQLDAASVVDTNAVLLRIESAPPLFAPNVQSIQARYRSDLQGIEANYLYPMYDTLTVLAGLRYVALDDDLVVNLDSAPQDFLYTVSTRNDLYGIQIGAVGTPVVPFDGFLSITAFGKLGIYGNDARQRSRFDTGAANLLVHASADTSSFVGEAGIIARMQLTERLALFGGYNLVWLDRIAVASDQIAASDFFNGTGSNDRGSAVFHGANVTIELRL